MHLQQALDNYNSELNRGWGMEFNYEEDLAEDGGRQVNPKKQIYKTWS
jgi:hypothetical protein